MFVSGDAWYCAKVPLWGMWVKLGVVRRERVLVAERDGGNGA